MPTEILNSSRRVGRENDTNNVTTILQSPFSVSFNNSLLKPTRQQRVARTWLCPPSCVVPQRRQRSLACCTMGQGLSTRVSQNALSAVLLPGSKNTRRRKHRTSYSRPGCAPGNSARTASVLGHLTKLLRNTKQKGEGEGTQMARQID